METNMQPDELNKTKLARNTRSAIFFAAAWALLMGAGAYLRSSQMEIWQETAIVVTYGISTVLFLAAMVMFWRRQDRIAKILSMLGFYPGMVVASTVQGGGAGILILVILGVAFTMMFGFMVESRKTRNRFLLFGLGFVALNLGFYFIPFPFRHVTVAEDSAGAGIPITIAAGLIAVLLILTQGRQGIRLFRQSIGVKLGVGFFLTTLVTFGFMVFAITVLSRVATDFDYSRYASIEQIRLNELSAEIRGMRLHLSEYLQHYGVEGLDEAYAEYISEYENHRKNANRLFEQLATLHEDGWGFYVPGEKADEQDAILATVQLEMNTLNTEVREIVGLINQRGFKDEGLEGEFRQAAQALESSPAYVRFPDMQALLLQMRRYEKNWILRQEPIDAERTNEYGADAIALLQTLDISVAERFGTEGMINGYLDVFNQVVEIDNQIADMVVEINRLAEPINPQLQDLVKAAESETEVAQQNLSATEGYVQNAAIGFGASAVVVAILVGFVVTRIVVRPIAALTQTASELAEGALDTRSDIMSQDETGTLAGVFNQMAERLQNMMSGLEETVNARTAELQERAREMEASQRVTFAASERTSPEDFLNLLVNLIADQFDVYHCQVYLVDEDKNEAVLSQSTGYAGRQLLQRGHAIPLETQSLVTQCINTGEAVLVAETAKDPNWLPNPVLPLTQSELVVPLKVGDNVIGAMDIQDRVASRFTEASVPVFESMTEHVAFLYENNELLESIAEAQRTQEQFVSQLETTSEVAGQLNTILDPTQLLDEAVAMLQNRFNFYHAHIYLVDEEKQNLVVASGSGHVGVILKDRGHSIPVIAEKSFVATAYRNATPVRVADTTQAPNWLPNPLLPDTRAEMAVPLITRGQVIGVLDIQDEVVGRFTEVDEDTMLTLAGQLATSVDTARLFVDVEHAAERDRTRFEIAEALSGNPSEDQVWDILLEKAMGENLLVTLSQVERKEDGSVITTIHRSACSDSDMTPPPVGQKLNISEAPGFVDRVGMLLINDVSTDEQIAGDYAAYLRSQGVASMLYAPFALVEGDEWQGMIRVSSKEIGYFTPERASMYTALIELGTVALRSARLRADVESAAERDLTRFEIAEALSGNPTEEEVWDILLEKAMDENLVVTLSLAEFTEDGGVKTVSHRSASSTPALEAPPVGEIMVIPNDPDYKILDFNEVFISNDVENDERIHPEFRKGITSRGVVSMLTTPISISDEGEWQGGVIRVVSSQPDFFDENQVSKYRTLIELGTIALRSARLRASIDWAAKRTETRLEVTQALAGNLTEDEVLDVLVEKAALYPDARIAIYYEDAESAVRTIVNQRDEVYDTGMVPMGVGTRISNDMMKFENVLLKDEVVIVDNVMTDNRLDEATKKAMSGVGYTSMATLPMQMSEDWVGYIFVTSKKEKTFDQEKITLYNILAEAGTVALRAARLRAEADQERERFRVLIENAPEAIVVFSGETGEFLEANQNAVELYEVPMVELIGNNPVALSPELQPDGRPSGEAAMGYIQEAIDGGTPVFDWVHRTGKGRNVPCEIRLVRLPGYDNPPRLRGSVTDISERAAAQQAIVQGDRLKSEFLANMSHELRTPLNSILGYTDVLLMGLDGELDEEVTIDLEAIHENSQHLLNLINDILDLAKIEAGRMTFEVGEVNVSQLLNEVKKTSAGLMVNKDVEMVVEADEELPQMMADYHRVYQVVNNLVSNAVKFTEEGTITLRAFAEGDEMVLQVVDTGIGISDEDLGVIFEEFTQADTSSTRQHEGTGLGLTITRRLVQLHGGTITVESELGKGSAFTARFPMQAKVNPELLVVVQSPNGNK